MFPAQSTMFWRWTSVKWQVRAKILSEKFDSECSPKQSRGECQSQRGNCEYLEIRMYSYMWRKIDFSWLFLEGFFFFLRLIFLLKRQNVQYIKCFSEKNHSWEGLFPITAGHRQFLGLHKNFLFKHWHNSVIWQNLTSSTNWTHTNTASSFSIEKCGRPCYYFPFVTITLQGPGCLLSFPKFLFCPF